VFVHSFVVAPQPGKGNGAESLGKECGWSGWIVSPKKRGPFYPSPTRRNWATPTN